MRTDQIRYERNIDIFEVDDKLMNGNVTAQEMLADTPKGAQEVAQPRPHTLRRIAVDFADTIAIIIPRSFAFAMTNGRARSTAL